MTLAQLSAAARKNADAGDGPLFAVGMLTYSEMLGLVYAIVEHKNCASRRGFASEATREMDTRVQDLIDKLETDVYLVDDDGTELPIERFMSATGDPYMPKAGGPTG